MTATYEPRPSASMASAAAFRLWAAEQEAQQARAVYRSASVRLEEAEYELRQARDAAAPRQQFREPGRGLGYVSILVLRAVDQHRRDHDGISPSLREIGSRIGLSSSSSVKHHLDRLILSGYLERAGDKPGRWRTLYLTPEGKDRLERER